MLRIAVVGDLSLQNPDKLDKVMGAAYPNCDILIHVGDIHPGYDVVNKYAKMGKQVFAVPGNHDAFWDKELPNFSRQWRVDLPEVCLIGIDNSMDHFGDKDWEVVKSIPDDKAVFIIVHKPLSTIVLPDGSESSHIMGEESHNADAQKLIDLIVERDVLLIHGHYHGWSFFKTSYADCLVEGRGGAAPQLGYTLITIQKEGWTLHAITL